MLRALLYLLSLLSFLTSLRASQKKGDANPSSARVSVADILNAWQNRSNRVRRHVSEWEKKVIFSRQALLSFNPTTKQSLRDVSLNTKAVLTLDGEKRRFEYSGSGWSGTQNSVVDQTYTIVLKQDTEKSLFDNSSPTDKKRVGFVQPRDCR